MTERTLAPAAPAAKADAVAVRPVAERIPLELPRERADGPPGGGLARDFALQKPHASRAVVLDGDAGRAFLTQWLVAELLPALGLDPSKIEIRINPESAARLDARGASGLVESGKVFLHPDRYAPQTGAGRRLLAHELAHLAQASKPLRSAIETPASRQLAEQEADRVGRAFEAREPITQIVAAILPTASAADDDFDQRLAAAVVSGRSREIDAIKRLLSGVWISDGDVFDVCRILESMPFAVARAVVHALGGELRYQLADNINTVHMQRNRSQVLACYDALDDSPKNNQFSAVDLSVLTDGPLDGLEGEERAAAVRTIRALKPNQQHSLLRSGNGSAVNRLMLSSGLRPLTSEQEKEQAKKRNALLEAEEKLSSERQAIAKLRDTPETKGIVDQLRAILNNKEAPPHQNAERAVAALAELHGTQFLAIAEQLEAEGLVDLIFTHLPEWAFFGDTAHTETLIELMRSRLPVKNLDYVEGLLSYGFFDWAVRDYEAKFAYMILKLLPLTAQYQFRQRDNGKWYMRLVENLPKEFTGAKGYQGDIEVKKVTKEEIADLEKSGFKALDPDELLVDVAAQHKQRLEADGTEGPIAKQIKTLVDAFEAAPKSDKPAQAYEKLHRDIAVVGQAAFKDGGGYQAADQLMMEIVVHELDRQGLIDKLFGELSDKFLYSEVNRIPTVKMMMARDPARVQYHARDLVSRGFTDWMVTDREAYLAWLCVKSLPDIERAAFVEQEPDKWSEILGEMSRDARGSADLNIFVGDKEGTERASVLGQLADRSTWSKTNLTRLDGLIHMSIAMTEHRFAFDRSEEFDAYKDTDLKPLVDKYALFDPTAAPPRDKYTPNILEGTKWYEEGLFATLRTIWAGLVFLFDNDLLLFTRSAGGNNLNLNQIQDVMGNDIKGARLADPEKSFGKEEPNPDANKLTLWVDIGAHAAYVRLPELRIESVNMQAAGETIQTGSILLKGLEIEASYDTDDLKQPTHAEITASSLEMKDLLVSFRTSMMAVSRFFLSTLRLGAGVTDTKTPSGATPRDGYYLPVPFLAPIASLVYYLFKLKGWGPDTPGTEVGRGLGEIRAIDVTFANLEVEGFQTSGGQNIGKLQVADFALRVGLNRTTALRAKMESLEQRIKRLHERGDDQKASELQEQYDQAEKELATLADGETRMLEIQQELLHGDPDAARRTALQAEIDKLALESTGGVYIDIGSIEASGISGTVTADEPIKLTDLHGEGTSPAMAAGLGLKLLTPEKLEQLAKGGKPQTLAEMGGEVTIDLGNLHTGRLAIGGGIRTAKQIGEKLKELEPNKASYELAPLYEHLQALQSEAELYERYLAVGVSSLNKTQLDDFRRLRDLLQKEPDIIFGSIDLVEARLGLDPAGGVSLGAKEATLKNIRLPERGITVDELKAVDVKASANANGLAAWLEPKKNIQGGSLAAESITISGARSDYHGLLVDKVTLTGRDQGEKLEASMDGRGNHVRLGVSVHAEGLGLAPRIGLMKQRRDGLLKKDQTKPDPATKAQIAELDRDIITLTELADTRARAYALLAKAKTKEEKAAAEQALMEAEGIIAYGLKQYSAAGFDLEGFGVEANGAGDILSGVFSPGGFDPMAALENGGVTIQGTGENNRLFKRLALSGAQTAEDTKEKSISGGAGAFEVGETKLNVTAKKDGDSIRVDVPQLDIASVALSKFLFTSDEGKGMQVWSTGQSSFDKLSFAGWLRLDAEKPGTRKLSEYRLAHVHMDSFGIAKIQANGLGYRSLTDKLSVDIRSGSVNGLYATNLDVDLPADKDAAVKITGKAGLTSIEDLDIGQATVDAFTVTQGHVNSKKLDLDFLEDGGIKADLEDLNLMSFGLRGPDGWANFSLSHLGGKGTYHKGLIDLEDVHLGSLVVPAIHWKMGAKGYVEADKPVKVEGLRLKGSIETEEVDAKPAKDAKPGEAKPGAKPEKETKLKKATIKEFHVDALTGEHLVYQDEENHIEIKPFDASMPKHMRAYEPLYIRNVNASDVSWEKGKGFTSGKADVEKYGFAAHYEGLKSGLKAGFGLMGGGMTGEITGPGTFGGSFGKIDKTGGYFSDKHTATKFASGAIIGNFAVGPDFVELSGIEVAGMALGKTTYNDAPSRSLQLNNALVDKITIGKVRQNYAKSTEPGKEEETVPTTLEVSDLVLSDVSAGKFVYDGSAAGKNAAGEDTSSTQHIEATGANIERLTISSLVQNKLTDEITASFKVDSGDSKLSALRVRGLVANMASKVGSKETITKIATSVDGGPISGDNITFGSVDLGGTVVGPDGAPVPVKRSTIKGKFQLDKLRLWSPEISIEETGKPKIVIGPYGRESGSIELQGVKPEFFSNGAVRLGFDSVTANNLRVIRDGVTIDIPFAQIKDIAVGLTGQGTEEGLDWLGARLGEIKVKGLNVAMSVKRQGNLSDSEYIDALTKYYTALANPEPKDTLIVEPLASLSGEAEGEVSVGWYPDPGLSVKIQNSILQSADLSNYALYVRPDHVGIGNFGVHRLLSADFDKPMPGFHEGGKTTWKTWPFDRGYINIKEVVEGLYNQPPGKPSKKGTDLSFLKRLNFKESTFSVGDGRAGLDHDKDGKLGDGDSWIELQRTEASQNQLKLLESNIGESLRLGMDTFRAGSAGFTAGKTQKGVERQGKTGPITLQGIHVSVTGLASFSFDINAYVREGTIEKVELGDLTFLETAKLEAVPPPTLKEVNSQATPVPPGGAK